MNECFCMVWNLSSHMHPTIWIRWSRWNESLVAHFHFNFRISFPKYIKGKHMIIGWRNAKPKHLLRIHITKYRVGKEDEGGSCEYIALLCDHHNAHKHTFHSMPCSLSILVYILLYDSIFYVDAIDDIPTCRSCVLL